MRVAHLRADPAAAASEPLSSPLASRRAPGETGRPAAPPPADAEVPGALHSGVPSSKPARPTQP